MLQGFSIGGYRSFGPNPQRIFPLRKLNIFAGPNNCGKSNILRFIRDLLMTFANDRRKCDVHPHDKHIGTPCQTTIGLGVNADPQSFKGVLKTTPQLLPHLASCLGSLRLDRNFIFFEGTTKTGSHEIEMRWPVLEREPLPFRINIAWEEAYALIANARAHGEIGIAVQGTMVRLFPNDVVRPVYNIATNRRISVNLLREDPQGQTLIQHLADLQHPKHNEQEKKKLFQSLNEFLRVTTDHPEATLEIPFSADEITVHMNNRALPLSSLGTGIEQVILLAAACTLRQNSLICLEEPELNLHPVLQRKLLKFLNERTTNQYFIATHSAAILDTPDASIFRVSLASDHTTVVDFVDNDAIRWNICRDLGYRASDIVQANCVIWVEGPSDRIYLKHWIESLDSSLVEGIHYAIFFYGGRLLSHLSADDTEVADFIKLKCLNRNIAIVIDSDKKNKNDELNATKTRIITEFRGDNSIAWVTAGREVENYVPSQTMLEAVAAEYPGRESKVKNTPFARVLPTVTDEKNSAIVDKIRVARAVVQKKPSINILDLQDRLKELIQFIRKANT